MDDCDQSDLFREEKDEQAYSQTDCCVWLKSGIRKRVALASVFSHEVDALSATDRMRTNGQMTPMQHQVSGRCHDAESLAGTRVLALTRLEAICSVHSVPP